jgi:hypothetical protein
MDSETNGKKGLKGWTVLSSREDRIGLARLIVFPGYEFRFPFSKGTHSGV